MSRFGIRALKWPFESKGVDGIIFVADSQIERTEANLESVENLRTTWFPVSAK